MYTPASKPSGGHQQSLSTIEAYGRPSKLTDGHQNQSTLQPVGSAGDNALAILVGTANTFVIGALFWWELVSLPEGFLAATATGVLLPPLSTRSFSEIHLVPSVTFLQTGVSTFPEELVELS